MKRALPIKWAMLAPVKGAARAGVAVVTGALALGACNEACERSGCDAFEVPVADATILTGVAGVAAARSDVVANGCETCGFSGGVLQIWQSADALVSEQQAALLIATEATHVVEIDERYELALTPGDYLICTSTPVDAATDETYGCVPFRLGMGEVVSAHIRASLAGSQLAVFLPGMEDPVGEIWELQLGR